MSPHPLPRRPGHSKSAYQRNTKTSRLWCVCLFDCPGESTERGEDCNLLRATSPLAGQSRHPPPDLCPRQSAVRCDKPRQTATDRGTKEAQPFAVHLFVQTKHLQKAGPSSVARLKMDLPFRDRLAHNRVRRRSATALFPDSCPCGVFLSKPNKDKPQFHECARRTTTWQITSSSSSTA